jgi:two-component system, NtrC family, C4-dicarboxylate transport sensor histidine kinase DctB
MRAEKWLPWLVAVMPAAAGALGGYSLLWYLSGDPDVFAMSGDKSLQTGVGVLAGVLLVSLALGGWGASILKRYREQIRVRENALRDFNASLEERVQEEVQKQRRHEKMLVQHSKMAAMDETAAMIAHHWEVPLQALAETLSSGREMAFEANRGAFSEKITAAEKSLGDMSHTLERIQALFRPDTAREQVVLSDALSEALQLIEKALASHGITLETRFDCSATLPLYRNEFVQVLLIILRNAKETLAARGVALPRIEIECYETGQFIVIRISDNGGGVDAAIEDRIFEPFFSTKTDRKSAGLGLYMARNIVEEHFNGELTFDNLSEGACFYIKLGKHQEETDV